jgi:hypothetical protein
VSLSSNVVETLRDVMLGVNFTFPINYEGPHRAEKKLRE